MTEFELRASLPDGTGSAYSEDASDYARLLEIAERFGSATWRHHACAVLFGALAERDPVKLRAALLDVGATLADWVGDLDARIVR